jgi:phosphoglycolate phosphatase-like HAD superfamily hydrolase
MSDTTPQQRLIPRTLVAGALALGLVAGGYGIANAATGTTTTTTPTTTLPGVAPASSAAAPQGWGRQRSDETLLTGDTLASVTAAANAKLPGATIDRVETDADGHGAYEAHMTKADGSLATVYVDTSFNVVSVETR